MKLTGKTRYRLGVYGCLVLQVEVEHDDPTQLVSMTASFPIGTAWWQDATVEDLQELILMGNTLSSEVRSDK